MPQKEKKSASVTKDLPCTLEQLYSSATLKQKNVRKLYDQAGEPHEDERLITVHIQKGWKNGTKLTFPKEGDQEIGETPGDLVFQILEQPHSRFTRSGNDLKYVAKISLVEALVGCAITVDTLDGRSLRIPINEIVTPAYVKVVTGEGMPKGPNEQDGFGDLIVSFNIEFPASLTNQQKQIIQSAFK